MKFYLSSYRLGNKPELFSDFFTSNKQVAVICNAIDHLPDDRRKELLERECTDMHSLGLQPVEVDLRVVDSTFDLTRFGGIWVRGGNVFNLRRILKNSGFDAVLTDWVRSGKPYGGYSAGVCVLSESLRGIELCDPVDAVPVGYDDEIEWSGLGILSYSVAPHYRSDHPESERIEKVVDYFIEHNMPHRTLVDGQAIYSNDSVERIV